MRAVKVEAPLELVDEVVNLAIHVGILSANVHHVEHRSGDGKKQEKAIVDVETSTPAAKRFTEELLKANFFSIESFSMSTRQPRCIISKTPVSEVTMPWVEPGTDIRQEFWQFSHLTWGLAIRVMISGGLLAYGIANAQLLIMISGILFLPTLPVVMAMGLGVWSRDPRLSVKAAVTFAASLTILYVTGVAVGSFCSPPIKYDEFNSVWVSIAISAGVGIAAALAESDDAGRRELIGLAATSQIAVIPVWLGLASVLGRPSALPDNIIERLIFTLVLNVGIILCTSLAVYIYLGIERAGKWERTG